MKRKIIPALIAALLTLALIWAAATARNARELGEALRAAQDEAKAATSQLAAEKERVATLCTELEKLQAQARRTSEEANLLRKLQALPRIENCTVSHYCTELYPHICGGGSGITASGVPVKAGVSCAVDPFVIPLGSTVYVDYGDGTIHTYIAHDTGSAVRGAHIDVAVGTHDTANQLGLRTATVWWEEGE